MIDMQGFPAPHQPARPGTREEPLVLQEFFREGPCRPGIALGDREGPEFLEGRRQG
jgi:hypothetical protein